MNKTMRMMLLASVLALSACDARRAPSFFMFGSYFPSWLLGAAIGIVFAASVRVLLIRLGVDEAMPARLLVYLCLAALFAMAFAYVFSPR